MEFWKLGISPKIQHFFWRAITGAIPTAIRLISRHVEIDPICQRCCLEEETINHVLFTCPYAQSVWRCSNIPNLSITQPSPNVEDNLKLLLLFHKTTQLPIEYRLLPFWLTWTIWKSRNEFIFNKRIGQPSEEVDRSFQLVKEWLEVFNMSDTSISPQTTTRHRSSQWEPPMEGWVKCNFDSSFRNEENDIGVGWIIRDDNGRHILSGSSRLRPVQTPLQAEAMGFLHVLQTLWIQGWRYIWFEGDNTELTSLINKGGAHIELGNLLLDIREWTYKLPQSSLAYVNREKNKQLIL